MHLVMDVGNTETAVGLVQAPGPEGAETVDMVTHWRFSTRTERTPDEIRVLLRALLDDGGLTPSQIQRVVVASVVPSVTEALRMAWRDNGNPELLVVDHEASLPVRLDVDEPRTVGADRIVNTLAASTLYGRDTIIVDLGTATTYDCITADGVFVGGVIAPGIRAGQEWLSGRTAKLPPVELQPPERVIGRRTEACLHSGIFYSAVDAVDGVVGRIREEWDRPDVLVVATGGYASRVAEHSRTVSHVEPLLTLYGLELAGRYVTEGSWDTGGRPTPSPSGSPEERMAEPPDRS